ncbi:hypothetical protein AWN76_017360 [Rhodothermaceae bacterium RA]|nr:hypothetical protein AWN76_017360 [Rhodothermaceae bacterium RA]
MALSFGLHPLLLLLCALGAAGLTYWMYRSPVPPLPPLRRGLLMGLRFGALFLILFLLAEPVLRRLHRDVRPPVLAVLLDDSQSLSLTAADADTAGPSFGTAVQEVVRRLRQEGLTGDVRYFAFSNDVTPLPGPEAIDSLHFTGARTNIARALDRVREDLQTDNLRSVLLISDGQVNTGRNPLYLAERYPVPIHTVTVGDTTSRRDLQIRRIVTNDIAYVDTELPVQVGLRSIDYGGELVTVTLLQQGQVLASTQTRLPTGTAEVQTELAFTPQEEGLQQWTVAVTRLDGEATYRNNSETFTVRVLESKRRILLLAAAPGPDVAALRRLLSADPHAEVSAFIQKDRATFYEGPFPEDVQDYDVIVLAGYPGRTASAAVLDRLRQALDEGTPALFLLTRQTNPRAVQDYLADVLPVAPEAVRFSYLEASFVPTPAATHHPVFSIPDVPPSAVAQLPPLLYNESRWRPTPDARVLATVRVRGIDLDDPILVLRRRGTRRSAAFLGAGTWRWTNLPEDLREAESYWPTLLSNLLQWVTTPEDDRPVRVRPITDLFAGGESVEFTGQVYDESLNPIPDASVAVQVTAPDGTQYPYQMESLGNGRYVLDTGVLPEGTYRYTATARRDGVEIGTDRGTFAVGALSLEFRETRADAALMRQIAARSGGIAFSSEAAGAIPARLAASGSFEPLVIEEPIETELWRRYVFLALILLLLTMEWFVRKRSGMV